MPQHRRKNIRLTGYDYASEGAYFVTIVTHGREPLFGKVVDGEMVLNECGRIVAEEWERSASIRAEIEIDEFVVMPNHFHAIVNIIQPNSWIDDHPVGAYGHTPLQQSTFRSPSRTLGALVRGFKSSVTTRINLLRGMPGVPVWQRNYYDRVIRSDREYEDIATYIANNPANWVSDRENLLPTF